MQLANITGFVITALALTAVGCGSTRAASDSAAGSERPAAGAPIIVAGSTNDAYSFEVTPWEGPVGEEGYVLVRIDAKGEHKINVQYPQRVSLNEPPAGLTLPLRELRLKDAQLESTKRMVFTIPVSSERAGEYRMTGSVKLSVCSEERCIIKERELVAKVTTQ